MNVQQFGFACGLGLMWPSLALAGPPDGQGDAAASGEASLTVDSDGTAEAASDTNVQGDAAADSGERVPKYNRRKDQKWIKRWAPERNMIELGVYGGLFLFNADHELFEPDFELERQGFQRLRQPNATIGGRFGYYPLRFFGLEVEGGAIPSRVEAADIGVVPFTVRGHVIAQLGLWSVTPFVVVGGGMLGVNSERAALGNDIDPALHFGGGVKFFLNRWLMLRLDVRDVVSHKRGAQNTFISHNLEATLGLSVTLNRKNERPTPTPQPVAGPIDSDGDGIFDPDDACVNEPETFNDFEDEDGCPESDRDGDGFWDSQDSCPDEAGVDPDGCPIRDTDGDGILDPDDACVDEPETFNGFEDSDGCPDELPEAIQKFTGTIAGITFDTNKATIRRSSLPTLDEAVKILKEYPDVRIEIAGHTDDRGKRDHNLNLSRERAEAVKSYLSGMGIAEDRISTAGFGPDVPIDTNDTRAGRANNRRIEFRIQGGASGNQEMPQVEAPTTGDGG